MQTAELGAGSAETLPPYSKISRAVDERDDGDLFGVCSIDEAVVSNEQLAIFTAPELRNPAATVRENRERLSCFEEIGN